MTSGPTCSTLKPHQGAAPDIVVNKWVKTNNRQQLESISGGDISIFISNIHLTEWVLSGLIWDWTQSFTHVVNQNTQVW